MGKMSDQDIVDKLKVNNLFLKIVDFYAHLKIANQRTSEGKETWRLELHGDLRREQRSYRLDVFK